MHRSLPAAAESRDRRGASQSAPTVRERRPAETTEPLENPHENPKGREQSARRTRDPFNFGDREHYCILGLPCGLVLDGYKLPGWKYGLWQGHE